MNSGPDCSFQSGFLTQSPTCVAPDHGGKPEIMHKLFSDSFGWIACLLVLLGTMLPLQGQTTIYQESFGNWSNGAPLNWTSTSSQPGWLPADSLPSGSSPAITGCDPVGSYLRFPSSIIPAPQPDSLISPVLNLSSYAGAPLELRFCLINPGPAFGEGDAIALYFSGDNGISWHLQNTDSAVYNAWSEQTYALPDSFQTTQFRLLFVGLGHQALLDIGLDNIRIFNPAPPCFAEQTSLTGSVNEFYCQDQEPTQIQVANSGSGASAYTYLITDPLDRILSVSNSGNINLAPFQPDEYRIYGISYTGGLIAPVNQLVTSISATGCAILSQNFLEFTLVDLEGIAVITSDYNGFAVSSVSAKNGAASISLSGGSGAYHYLWSSAPTINQDSVTDLPAGIQTITVTDSMTGCIFSDTLILSAPPLLDIMLSPSITYQGFDLSCPGSEDGALSAQVSGGVAPYSFSWNHDLSNASAFATSLSAGKYVITVTDANGAEALDSLILREPDTLRIIVDNIKPACADQVDGAILLSGIGGTGSYRFQWDHGPIGNILAGLKPDSYRVEMQDENGCALEQEFVITEAIHPIIVPEVTQPACFGSADGSIELLELAGQSPFLHVWQRGDTGRVLSSLAPGNYQILTVDGFGCRDTNVVRLNSPSPMRATLMSTPDTGSGTGTATISVTGGTPPYSAIWPLGDTTLVVDNLRSGTFPVTVLDANGCALSLEVQVDASAVPDCLAPDMGFSPNGDGINDLWELPCIDDYTNQEIQVLNRWGQRVFFSLGYSEPWDGRTGGEALPSGTYYYLIVMTLNGQPLEFKGTLSIVR